MLSFTTRSSYTQKSFVERHNIWFAGISILLNLVLVARFIQLWIAPTEALAGEVYGMAILVGFEFIMVHSGVFMALLPRKWSLLLAVPAYGIFAVVFNLFTPDNRIIVAYFLVVLNRMRFAFSNPSLLLRKKGIFYSAFAVVVYFILIVFVSAGKDFIPEYGLDYAFTHSHAYETVKLSGGILTDEPKTAMAFGTIYYLLLSLIELVLNRKRG
jgi:hypothetical protein